MRAGNSSPSHHGVLISFLEKRQLDLLSIVPGFRLGLDRVPKQPEKETHSVYKTRAFVVTLRSKKRESIDIGEIPVARNEMTNSKIHRIKNDERSARISLSFFSCKWGSSGSRY